MKSQTQEKTQLDIRPEKKHKELEVLNISYFYKKFINENTKFKRSRFCVLEKKQRDKKVVIPFSIYKTIIKEYFKIYFNEFYFLNNSVYFPFGGFLKKVLYGKWRANQIKPNTNRKKTTFRMIDNAIGLFWYKRPSVKMFYMVKLVKLTGSSNQLPKIEKEFLKNNDKDLIPIFTKEYKEAKDKQILYRYY